MEKKMTLEEARHMDVQCFIVGLSILFSALTAMLGFGMLSIGYVMVLAIYFVMNGVAKDLRELCNDLAEECENE